MTFKDELKQLYTECSVEDWDGYGAHPINKASVELVLKFVSKIRKSFPSLPDPELCPDPDGDLGVYWGANGHRLSLSVDKESIISYAVIWGNNTTSKGTEVFTPEKISDDLLDIFTKLVEFK
jgi:hypothetical protein